MRQNFIKFQERKISLRASLLTALFNSRSARQIAKFAARVPSFPRRPICKSAHRAFDFSPPSIRNLRARFAAARTTLLYTAVHLCAFFSLFCISPHPSSIFSRARPVFKFCRFARSIRSGYERTCAQTPSLRALFTRRCARILSKFYAEFRRARTYIRAAVINASF